MAVEEDLEATKTLLDFAIERLVADRMVRILGARSGRVQDTFVAPLLSASEVAQFDGATALYLRSRGGAGVGGRYRGF